MTKMGLPRARLRPALTPAALLPPVSSGGRGSSSLSPTGVRVGQHSKFTYPTPQRVPRSEGERPPRGSRPQRQWTTTTGVFKHRSDVLQLATMQRGTPSPSPPLECRQTLHDDVLLDNPHKFCFESLFCQPFGHLAISSFNSREDTLHPFRSEDIGVEG